jgi:AcrR family transcriptional regulator
MKLNISRGGRAVTDTDVDVEVLRRQPAQDRSAQRLELILDTTAALIDELGVTAITPAMVARRAGMSGPAIYRYFSDADSIIRALARRNLERFLEATQRMLSDQELSWQDAIAGSVTMYNSMYRDEPGFANLRFGWGRAARFSETETNLGVVARSTIGFFQPRYETWERPGLLPAVEVMLQIIEALVGRAHEGDNSEFFVAEATRLAINYLDEFLITVPGTPPVEGSGE